MNIKTVTILGANGTLGGNIAGVFAAFGAAKVYMMSRDIEESKRAVSRAAKAVRAEGIVSNLIPVDYSSLAECVLESDIVFESVAEDLKTKRAILDLITPYLSEDKLIFTGTSGLSITTLAETLPIVFRKNYFGVHFFNPPYQLTLCELTPTKYCHSEQVEALDNYLTTVLLRSVIVLNDLPAFLGNRIGFKLMNEALQFAEQFKNNGGIDFIDALLGPFTGRSMPPILTVDFVGLDIHKAIVDNLYMLTSDYAHPTFKLPQYIQTLIDEGKLGRKSREGLYKTLIIDDQHKKIQVYDIETQTYRDKLQYNFPFVERMIVAVSEGDYASATSILVADKSIEAQITLEFLLKYVVYSVHCSLLVANDVHAADTAMTMGFNWAPPLGIVEMISEVCDFTSLVEQRLDRLGINKTILDEVKAAIEPSRYDYRRYIKALK